MVGQWSDFSLLLKASELHESAFPVVIHNIGEILNDLAYIADALPGPVFLSVSAVDNIDLINRLDGRFIAGYHATNQLQLNMLFGRSAQPRLAGSREQPHSLIETSVCSGIDVILYDLDQQKFFEKLLTEYDSGSGFYFSIDRVSSRYSAKTGIVQTGPVELLCDASKLLKSRCIGLHVAFDASWHDHDITNIVESMRAACNALSHFSVSVSRILIELTVTAEHLMTPCLKDLRDKLGSSLPEIVFVIDGSAITRSSNIVAMVTSVSVTGSDGRSDMTAEIGGWSNEHPAGRFLPAWVKLAPVDGPAERELDRPRRFFRREAPNGAFESPSEGPRVGDLVVFPLASTPIGDQFQFGTKPSPANVAIIG